MFFPHAGDQNKKIIYNSRTGATASIESEYLEEMGVGFKETILVGEESQYEELIELLKMGEFVIPEKIDEKKLIHLEYLKSKFSNTSLDLTVIPTLSCNFACIYCYEKGIISNEYMSKENQRALLEFINQQAPFISNLHITWYGGEPLLALSMIESMTEEILNICSKHSIKYAASIVTNGYLLSKNTLGILEKNLVKDIQITLDGMAETHDIRRPLKDEKCGTFYKIIENLIDGKELLPEEVMLRINVDKDNINEAYDLIDFLKSKDLMGYVSPYLGKIENHNDCYSEPICLSEIKYAESTINFMAKAYPSLLDFHPKPIFNFCGADFVNSYTINFDGSLYKCWEDIGIADRIIGHIQNESIEKEGVFFDYILYDPFNNESCSECKHLPLCLGGCPRRRNKTSSESCDKIREHLRRYMELASQKW